MVDNTVFGITGKQSKNNKDWDLWKEKSQKIYL